MTAFIRWCLITMLACSFAACEPSDQNPEPATVDVVEADRQNISADDALVTGGDSAADAGKIDYMVRYSVKDEFDYVQTALKQAIINKGLKINNVSHIGEMLRRTASDVGSNQQIYTHAEAYEFCSATVSRKTMEANPDNIVFCPYIIAVYQLPTEPDTVYVAYRKPQLVGDEASQEALREVEILLDDIARDALTF